MGFSLALVGAGYLVGIVGGLAVLLGLVLTWGVAVPWPTASTPMPAGATLASFGTSVWSTQARFIGAGTIGIAAIWTLATLFKPMVEGVRASMGALRGNSAGARCRAGRRDPGPTRPAGGLDRRHHAGAAGGAGGHVCGHFLAPSPLDDGAM